MKIELRQGDITKIEVDAIVNAANTSLLGGGGVDGAIHRAGGKAILEECRTIRNRQGGCATGDAVITTAGNLPAQFVIHTVGPVWRDGQQNETNLLKSCYINSLHLAEAYNIQTIAFPNISTGIYRFPKQKAAEIAIEAIRSYPNTSIKNVIFVCFDDTNFEIYQSLLKD
ncbi:MAG: O-acetyl-ADP-ribose deacetylase [Saprospiraceae bacterium]